jgi:rubrerythrin
LIAEIFIFHCAPSAPSEIKIGEIYIMETTSLLDAIRVAKENERTASDFYANAAKTTGSQLGRQLFEQLAVFEQYHYARITLLEQSLEETDNFIYYEGKELLLPPKLEPKAAEEPQHQTVVNIINQAIELEKEAEKAYADLAGKITDPTGHAMFSKLSEEEHKHYLILSEAYWSLTNLKTWQLF